MDIICPEIKNFKNSDIKKILTVKMFYNRLQ